MQPSPLLAPPKGHPSSTLKGTLCGSHGVRLADVEVDVKGTFVPLPQALRALALENPYPTLSMAEKNSSMYVTTDRARARTAITDPARIRAIRQHTQEEA